MLAIFCFTTHLNDCLSECTGRQCTFALSLFSLLRRLPHVKRLLIGQLYDHAANMNNESVKNCRIQRWFADTARGKVCDFPFLTSYGGKFYEFFMTVALAIPPLTVKNRPCALIRACVRLIRSKWYDIPVGVTRWSGSPREDGFPESSQFKWMVQVYMG